MRPPFIPFWKRRRKSWSLFLWDYNKGRDAFGGINEDYFCYPWYTSQGELFHVQLKGWQITYSWKTAFLQRFQFNSALMKWEPSNRQNDNFFNWLLFHFIPFLGYSLIPMEGSCSYPASLPPSLIQLTQLFAKGGMISRGQNATVGSPLRSVMIENRHKSFPCFLPSLPFMSPVCMSDLGK